MDRDQIERYRRGAHLPAAAIEGLIKELLLAFPIPGTWSIQQIVLHLMDSDLIGSDRMKRIIAEEKPQLIGYNESAFATALYYHDLDVYEACDIFAKNRLMTAEILRRLPEDKFLRTGVHNEDGEITLAKMVSKYADHLEYHLSFIHEKRRLLGSPLS
jgi:hypothetical protein